MNYSLGMGGQAIATLRSSRKTRALNAADTPSRLNLRPLRTRSQPRSSSAATRAALTSGN